MLKVKLEPPIQELITVVYSITLTLPDLVEKFMYLVVMEVLDIVDNLLMIYTF